MYTAYFDGLCEPVNPCGIAAWGVHVLDGAKIVHEDCGLACEPYSSMATNNVAEYTALIKALEFCAEYGMSDVTVRGDSQLVIRQMNGVYSVKSPRVFSLYRKIMKVARRFR